MPGSLEVFSVIPARPGMTKVDALADQLPDLDSILMP